MIDGKLISASKLGLIKARKKPAEVCCSEAGREKVTETQKLVMNQLIGTPLIREFKR